MAGQWPPSIGNDSVERNKVQRHRITASSKIESRQSKLITCVPGRQPTISYSLADRPEAGA